MVQCCRGCVVIHGLLLPVFNIYPVAMEVWANSEHAVSSMIDGRAGAHTSQHTVNQPYYLSYHSSISTECYLAENETLRQ